MHHGGEVVFFDEFVWDLNKVRDKANRELRERLQKEGYYEARTTPGLWRHKCRPIQFCLVVDDFGVEYVGNNMHIIWQLY